MALKVQIHEVRLRTSTGESKYAFSGGLNVISGSYGTGKSSLLELIKYGLGAKSAELMPTIHDRLITVTIDVSFGASRVEMTREVGKHRISVAFRGASDRIEQWSATRIKSAPLASDRILQLLGVPSVRIARRGANGNSVAVSFFDMYRYVYLPQADVPRSVVGHLDKFLDPKRKAVLELAYGLSDEVVNQLKVDVVEFEQAMDRARIEAKAVSEFLERAGAPSREELDSAISQSERELRLAEQALFEARSAVAATAATVEDQGSLRERIASLRALTADYDSERVVAGASVERNSAVIAQLELDVQRNLKSETATQALLGYEFVACPRCLQTLPPRDDPHECLLCGQLESDHEHGVDTDGVRAQLEEARELLLREQIRFDAATHQLQAYRNDLRDAVNELESQLQPELVLPGVDRVGTATSDLERTRANLRELERFQDQWDAQQELADRVTHYADEIATTKVLIEEALATLERNRFRLESLREAFEEEIRELGFGPGAVGGIDANYLPLIDGDKFEELSVAGARKVLANDAYYLASLTNALADSGILLPGLLIIDGPRTSLGDTVEDRAAGERLYRRFRLLADAYPDAQIIVADNGYPTLPAGTRPVNVITLTYDKALLQDVPHPGQGKVPTVGQPTAG